MSKFVKGNLTVTGNRLQMSLPFAKVNKDKRTVSGYATLDNIDSQDDVVTAEASAKAFARARGNLREMHDKIAVGKIVDFKEEEYFDEDSGELYRGLWVNAYVSKGAENTWQKVLDGTLSGFSIGGEIIEADNQFVKEAGRKVRFIKDYDLSELSLVDNPANPLANVFSIQKSATGSVKSITGMASEINLENVFICKDDSTVTVSSDDSADCPVCETKMENAGWFESGADRTEKVKDIVSKFRKEAPETDNSEGGVEMAKKNVYGDQTPVPEGKETGVVNPSEEFPDGDKVDVNAESVDETAGTEDNSNQVPDEETQIAKKISELQEVVQEALDNASTETKEQIVSLEKKIEQVTNEFREKASELEKTMSQFGEKLETTKSRQSELEKVLDRLNSSDALKKSADLEYDSGPVVKEEQKWTPGAFSGNRRRFSIDNHV